MSTDESATAKTYEKMLQAADRSRAGGWGMVADLYLIAAEKYWHRLPDKEKAKTEKRAPEDK